jgi:hypothetical protein
MFFVRLTIALIGQREINVVQKAFMLSAIKEKLLIAVRKLIVRHLSHLIFKQQTQALAAWVCLLKFNNNLRLLDFFKPFLVYGKSDSWFGWYIDITAIDCYFRRNDIFLPETIRGRDITGDAKTWQ